MNKEVEKIITRTKEIEELRRQGQVIKRQFIEDDWKDEVVKRVDIENDVVTDLDKEIKPRLVNQKTGESYEKI